MINGIILAAGAIALLSVWLVVKKRQNHERGKRQESLAGLEEVLRSAEATNSVFFQSLELVQKNLESLLARAEGAEQRLRALMLQPGVEKREQYSAAALLLGEGQEPQRVASMLNLPLPQIQVVQELQKIALKKKARSGRLKADEPDSAWETTRQTKIADPWEKTAARPIPLVEAIRNAADRSAHQGNGRTRFGGLDV